jgi:cytochrome c553
MTEQRRQARGDSPRFHRGLWVMMLACLPLVEDAAAAPPPARSDAAKPTAEQLAFFESKVKPLLEARCFQCHGPNAKAPKGGLRLDSRTAILKGGESGPAAVAGDVKKSRILDAVNYRTFEMPPKSKLPAGEIAILTKWVKMGLPFPKENGKPVALPAAQFPLEERKKSHWAWQPIRKPKLPRVRDRRWAATEIDRFILAKLEAKGLKPNPPADRRTLIRRATFDLIGLPPTPKEVAEFVNDPAPTRQAFATVVDRLLKSPHFGERWARHWLDSVRYADTLGHEFDYTLRHAYQYRDYVIRAFNADVPYDQFVKEHIAGDLLKTPRRHPTLGYNESIIGTGFWFLGEDKHAPVDVKGEEASKIDNQLDVFSKTFLGLTVACARCHDHKFDAISTKDYYALAGFLQSSHRDTALLDPQGKIGKAVAEIQKLKRDGEKLLAAPRTTAFQGRRGDDASKRPARKAVVQKDGRKTKLFADFNGKSFDGWRATGFAFGDSPTQPSEWDVTAARGLALSRKRSRLNGGPFLEPGVANSRRYAEKLGGVLRSPTFTITHDEILYRVKGENARIRLIIDGYRMDEFSALLFKDCLQRVDTGGKWTWLRQTGDIHRYKGHRAHIELIDDGAGWLAVDEIHFANNGAKAESGRRKAEEAAPPSAFRVPPSLDDLRKKIHIIQSSLPDPIPVIAITDGSSEDEHVFIRGSHRNLGPVVPRRMLEAISGPNQKRFTKGSGRLELAEGLLDPANPFPARVMVNRLWHHLTGRGIVASVDNFGVLGQRPTHPELLDWLAATFRDDRWSMKRAFRRIMLSSTYMMSSDKAIRTLAASGSPATRETLDPQNLLLHRMRIRRLQGESIRDSMLAVSHRLDKTQFGQPVPIHLTPFMQGRGRPGHSGPLDGHGRRSIYVIVRRNFLSPMMLAFDTPIPFTAIGRRNVSNVPAQALILMNDPFVIQQAGLWAKRVLAEKDSTPEVRIRQMYETAFARPPSAEELKNGLRFLQTQAEASGLKGDAWKTNPRVWSDYGHVLYNVKEFIYVR